MKRKYCLKLVVVAALSLVPFRASAQESGASGLYSDTQAEGLWMPAGRHRSQMVAIGSVEILDTYLSSEKYKGAEVCYIGESRRPLSGKNPGRWGLTTFHEGRFHEVSNRADNNDELGGHYRFQCNFLRRWNPVEGLFVEAGGGIGVQAGFLYNTRNSNNPAQAYASAQLLPTVSAAHPVRLLRRVVSLRYEVSAPLAGLMFSPNYGQSYYEIFSRGNYDHNVVPTTILSTPSLRHTLTADIPLSRRKPRNTLRIGYLGDYQQAKVNGIRQHQYAHLLVLGWTIASSGK